MSAGKTLGVAVALAVVAGLAWLSLGRGERPARERAAPLEVRANAPAEVALVAVPPRGEGRAAASEVATSTEGEHTQVARAKPETVPTLRVRVVRLGDEAPLAGARVVTKQGASSIERTTDERGTCALPCDRAAECVPVSVEKEGYARQCGCYQTSDELELTLAPTSTLFGHVLAADTGQALAGVRILLPDDCEEAEPVEVRSGDDGRYELPGVALQQAVTVILAAEGFPEQYKRFEVRAEGPRVEVDLRLERGLEIQGRVVDLESGAGLAGARVDSIVADGRGAFRGRVLVDPSTRRASFRVQAEGHCSLNCGYDVEALASLLELRLPRGAVVEGAVSDGHGQPVAGASVRLDDDFRARIEARKNGLPPVPTPLSELPKSWRFEPEGEACVATTDVAGRYRIANAVPWGQHFAVRAFAEGFDSAPVPLDCVGAPGAVTRVDLVLASANTEASVHCELRLNGQPFQGGSGRVTWIGPRRNGSSPITGDSAYMQVEPGEVAFRVELDAFPTPLEGTEFTLQVEPGTLEHRIELRGPTRPIGGRVTFEDGAPAAKAAVEASLVLRGNGQAWMDRLHLFAETAADGSYRLDVPDVERGFRVQARLDNAENTREGIRSGDEDVALVLARAGALLFRYRDADEGTLLPAWGFTLSWRPVGESAFRPLFFNPNAPDPEGWYEIRMPAGFVDLKAAENFARNGFLPTLSENLRILPAEPLRLELAMQRGLVARMRLAPGVEPLPRDHALVLVESELHDEVRYVKERNSWESERIDGFALSQRRVRFDEQGSATVTGLVPGRFRIEVFPDDIALEPAELTLVEGENGPVLVRWTPR